MVYFNLLGCKWQYKIAGAATAAGMVYAPQLAAAAPTAARNTFQLLVSITKQGLHRRPFCLF